MSATPPEGGKWPRDKVIESIDAKTNTFFVIDPFNRKRSEVGVVRRLDDALTCVPMPMATGTTICCRWTNVPLR
jgi:hypothetical protein